MSRAETRVKLAMDHARAADLNQKIDFARGNGARARVPERVYTGLNQDTWWKDAHQLIHLITNMEPRWRANCARMLVDKAGRIYLQARSSAIIRSYWSYVEYASDKDWGPVDIEEPTSSEVLAMVRREMDRGKHLEMVWTSKLFGALTNGPEVLRELDAPWHTGVLGGR